MRIAFGCIASALLGGLFAVLAVDARLAGRADAQDPARDRAGPAFPEVPRARPGARPPAERAPLAQFPAGLAEDDELSPEERINVAVYESANRAVAHITTRGVREGMLLFDVPTEGTGSGSVIDKHGHILTNNHVIDGARQVTVTLFDGQSYEARFVGNDPINDLAVIKVDAPQQSLHPLAFGDSRRLKVGMRVYALGNPFGLERTLTTGIISSLNRALQIHETRTIKSIIQTDASINPGSSGGPLLDTRGRLIGMNTAIATKTGQSAGVSFAIPVSIIARIVPQLIERGRVVRPEIGITKVYETEQGLLIFQLAPDGPAQRAGLRGPEFATQRRGPFKVQTINRNAADLIVAVDGEKTTTADDFLSYIESKRPGDRVMISVIRQGKEVRVPVVLGGGDEVVPAPAKSRI